MTFLQIPVLMLMAGNMLYVLCIFLSSALGLKGSFCILGLNFTGLHICMAVIGIVIIAYTATGGLLAVIVTDTVQFIIAIIASALLAFYSIVEFSDGGSFIVNIKNYVSNPPHPGYFHPINDLQPFAFTLAWIVLQIFSHPGSMQVIQRCICVPDERAAQKSYALATVFFLLVPIIWLLPVFLLRNKLPLEELKILWPHIKNPAEASYITIALRLLPNGMIGLVISAVLAASISTLAGCYNIVSVIFTKDIYQKFSPQASSGKLMTVGRISSLFIGIISICIGLILAGLADAFRTTFTIVSLVSIAVSFPIMLGLLFKKTPSWTGAAAIIICLITTSSIEFIVPAIHSISPNSFCGNIIEHSFEYKTFAAIIVSLLTFGISPLFNKSAKSANSSAKFFELLDKPIGRDETAGRAVLIPNLMAYRVTAISLLIFGVPLSLCKVFNITRDPYSINLIAGICFITLSVLIYWLTSIKYSPLKIIREQADVSKTSKI
jgi:Na+/proline symporter